MKFYKTLRKLFPDGSLWNFNTGTNLDKILKALAYMLDYIYKQGVRLVNEYFVYSATETLDNWEAEYNILRVPGSSVQQRRDGILVLKNTNSEISKLYITTQVKALLQASESIESIETLLYGTKCGLMRCGEILRSSQWDATIFIKIKNLTNETKSIIQDTLYNVMPAFYIVQIENG